MKLETFIVNAFSEEIAGGNPAGIVILKDPLPEELLQSLAFDINKSETAFLTRTGESEYLIRWFTPLREVDLCGYATLAAAKVIFHKEPGLSRIRFEYRKGELYVSRDQEGTISMSFPLDLALVCPAEEEYRNFFDPPLKVKEAFAGQSTKKVVLVLEENSDLKSIKPDFSRMERYKGQCCHGLGITKPSDTYDFESRFFNPWYGVNEDPVTGSLHTLLADYWSRRLGKRELKALQSSPRPGVLNLTVDGERVIIKGKARIFIEGSIRLP